MAFRGFDAEQIRILASDLRGRGEAATGLHSELRAVLREAQDLLDGTPVTTDPSLLPLVGFGAAFDLFGPSCLPGSLHSELPDIADEMDRRRQQLEGCIELEEQGYSVDRALLFADEPPPSAEDITAALEAIQALDGKDFGVNGNRDDLQEIAEQLRDLSDAELDALLIRIPAEDLRRLNDLMWINDGLPRGQRQSLLSDMMSRVGHTSLSKLTDAFPWVRTSADNSVPFENGEIAGWEVPSDPLFAPDGSGQLVSNDDLMQGRFGDCWYLSSLAAIAQRDPEFIQEGIRQNPNGTVSVRIWDQSGEVQWVTVTPELPVKPDGTPASAYGQGETWPAYYEKAFAQVYSEDNDDLPAGTYGAIEGDFTEKSPSYLTGNDAQDAGAFYMSDYDAAREAWENGHPVTISTPSEADGYPESWNGSYATSHAYYVKGFDENGNVIVGNPWGPDSGLVVTPEQFNEYFENPQMITIPQ
jgi:hypothetical protein